METDMTRSLLRLTFTQRVSLAQTKEYRVKVDVALAQLQPGFRILTDLTGLEEMEFACAADIRDVMDRCREKGVAEVVRVIPDPKKDIGFKIMSFFHYGHEVPILTCETLEEAQERLD